MKFEIRNSQGGGTMRTRGARFEVRGSNEEGRNEPLLTSSFAPRTSNLSGSVMKKVAGCLTAMVVLFFLIDLAAPFPQAKLRRQPATVVFDRNGDPMRIILPADQKLRVAVTLDEVPPELVRAVLSSEDRW